MYHLKLCKGRSYCGVGGALKATRRQPDAYTEDKATADAAVASGYFKLVGENHGFPPAGEVTGYPDREQLESMTIPDLKKLAEGMGVFIKGLKDKGLIIAAILAHKDSTTVPDPDSLAAMSDEELKALVEEKGIDLTGCNTREDALEAISVALGGSYTMLDLMRE